MMGGRWGTTTMAAIKYRNPRHLDEYGTVICNHSQVEGVKEDLLRRGLIIISIQDDVPPKERVFSVERWSWETKPPNCAVI
jgi:hypothetical protein